ncbi:MAG TPA: pilin [Candidatus Saccharimonadales bacterium]|nr:pilin [Candidatus Saccharimonadales bacterium]
MNKIKNILLLTLLPAVAIFSLAPAAANAANPAKDALQCGANQAAGENCQATPSTNNGLDDTIKTIINVLSAIVGVAAIIMIIVGGFRYITSGGDTAQVASAKNTLLYAVIGLVVAALAQVLVRFVLTKVT